MIENVPGAPLRRDLLLCGEQFGLRVHRHRWFELGGWFTLDRPHTPHRLQGARHNCDIQPDTARLVAGHYANHPDACDAMDIDWMRPSELREAIPPAYAEFIGRAFHRQKAAA